MDFSSVLHQSFYLEFITIAQCIDAQTKHTSVNTFLLNYDWNEYNGSNKIKDSQKIKIVNYFIFFGIFLVCFNFIFVS